MDNLGGNQCTSVLWTFNVLEARCLLQQTDFTLDWHVSILGFETFLVGHLEMSNSGIFPECR